MVHSMIEQVVAVEAELSRVLGARPRDSASCVQVLERAVALSRSDPVAAEVWVEAELLDELVDCYEAVGRVDDAISAMYRAIEVGWAGQPDGRCRVAELLMRDGRADEADPIWAQVKADTPDDVWLYNNAGLEYAAIGDHQEALGWLTEGLRLAIDTRDPEELVPQLIRLRAEALTALGLPTDDLQDGAAGFLANPPPPAARAPSPFLFPPADPGPHRCTHRSERARRRRSPGGVAGSIRRPAARWSGAAVPRRPGDVGVGVVPGRGVSAGACPVAGTGHRGPGEGREGPRRLQPGAATNPAELRRHRTDPVVHRAYPDPALPGVVRRARPGPCGGPGRVLRGPGRSPGPVADRVATRAERAVLVRIRAQVQAVLRVGPGAMTNPPGSIPVTRRWTPR